MVCIIILCQAFERIEFSDNNFWFKFNNETTKEMKNSFINKVNEFYHFSEPYEPKPVLNAALTVVRGHNAPMDLVRVETKSEVLDSSYFFKAFFLDRLKVYYVCLCIYYHISVFFYFIC